LKLILDIIYVEKIKEIELRHILLIPSVSEEEVKLRKKITIRNKIIDKKYHLLMLQEQSEETRANGGVLINPNTQDTRFELTKWILHYTVKF
jgi:peptidyl-prolyl cis-trans isomerase SurA